MQSVSTPAIDRQNLEQGMTFAIRSYLKANSQARVDPQVVSAQQEVIKAEILRNKTAYEKFLFNLGAIETFNAIQSGRLTMTQAVDGHLNVLIRNRYQSIRHLLGTEVLGPEMPGMSLLVLDAPLASGVDMPAAVDVGDGRQRHVEVGPGGVKNTSSVEYQLSGNMDAIDEANALNDILGSLSIFAYWPSDVQKRLASIQYALADLSFNLKNAIKLHNNKTDQNKIDESAALAKIEALRPAMASLSDIGNGLDAAREFRKLALPVVISIFTNKTDEEIQMMMQQLILHPDAQQNTSSIGSPLPDSSEARLTEARRLALRRLHEMPSVFAPMKGPPIKYQPPNTEPPSQAIKESARRKLQTFLSLNGPSSLYGSIMRQMLEKYGNKEILQPDAPQAIAPSAEAPAAKQPQRKVA
ncbi:MAG: hypothetical protein JWM56_930 [Candidatus Peribacteria bacterium]|nr:hypothetical protein [Candidatus Peribacteria bacterium]